MIRVLCFCLFPAALVPLAAQAQPLAAGEQTILVTGHGLDPGLGEDVYDIVTIDAARLANSPSNRLEDVLRDVPGFQQFRRS
ncbi:MAG: TonB-dependent receptor, partial [Allosphingosinicella sp.]